MKTSTVTLGKTHSLLAAGTETACGAAVLITPPDDPPKVIDCEVCKAFEAKASSSEREFPFDETFPSEVDLQ